MGIEIRKYAHYVGVVGTVGMDRKYVVGGSDDKKERGKEEGWG